MTGRIEKSIELLKAAYVAEQSKVGEAATPEAHALLEYLLDNFPAPKQGAASQAGRAAADLNYDLILLKMGLVPNKRVPEIPKIDDAELIAAMWPLGMVNAALHVFGIRYPVRSDGTRVPDPFFARFSERFSHFTLTN